VRRGVKVRVIANNDEIMNVLKQVGCDVKRLLTAKLVHPKMMIIDNKIAVTGSHNYTQSAFQMNYEISMILQGQEEIQRLMEFFNNLFF
jgi:phosphatidylserine/phosphatidylglycerophosphate/cardiolipin synthase-like enzyme